MFSLITDWAGTYQPVILRLLAGQSLDGYGFYNPSYALAPLIPFALLGEWGSFLFFIAALFAFILIAWRLNPARWSALVICLSPFVLASLKYENIEWLVLLGLIMPRPIGILFLLVKPQMTILVAGYWMYQAWQEHKLIGLLCPVICAWLFAFVLDPLWLGRMLSYSQNPNNAIANFSLFPYGLIVAATLTCAAWRCRQDGLIIGATPFAMPFVTATAWAGLPFALLHSWQLSLLGLAAQWAMFIRAHG